MNKNINIAIPTPLFLIFLVLKLTGVVDWSWWIVTIPLWLPFLVFVAVFIFVFFIAMILAVLK